MSLEWYTDPVTPEECLRHPWKGGRNRWSIDWLVHNTLVDTSSSYTSKFSHVKTVTCFLLSFIKIAWEVLHSLSYCIPTIVDTQCSLRFNPWLRWLSEDKVESFTDTAVLLHFLPFQGLCRLPRVSICFATLSDERLDQDSLHDDIHVSSVNRKLWNSRRRWKFLLFCRRMWWNHHDRFFLRETLTHTTYSHYVTNDNISRRGRIRTSKQHLCVILGLRSFLYILFLLRQLYREDPFSSSTTLQRLYRGKKQAEGKETTLLSAIIICLFFFSCDLSINSSRKWLENRAEYARGRIQSRTCPDNNNRLSLKEKRAFDNIIIAIISLIWFWKTQQAVKCKDRLWK